MESPQNEELGLSSEDYGKSTLRSKDFVAIVEKKEADVGTGWIGVDNIRKVFQRGPRRVYYTIYAPGHHPTPSELRERAFLVKN